MCACLLLVSSARYAALTEFYTCFYNEAFPGDGEFVRVVWYLFGRLRDAFFEELYVKNSCEFCLQV